MIELKSVGTPTIGDCIRAASDEEIAEFILKMGLDDTIRFCKSKPECNEIMDSGGTITDEMCRKCCIDWLRQPAGECKNMKLVYLAHPFLGKPENVEDAQNIILKLLHKYPDISFYSPLHATGFFYFELSYERGMAHCFEVLRRCDELWLCRGWEESRGCKMEVDYARRIGLPIKTIGEDYEIYNMLEASN